MADKDFVDSIAEIVKIWGEKLTEDITESLGKKDMVHSGVTAASFKPDVKIGEDFVEFTLEAPSYYDVLDKGGKRWTDKQPPVDSILKWMKTRGIKATIPVKKQTLASTIKKKKMVIKKVVKPQTQLEADKSYAFGIAANIKKKGVIERFGYRGSNFYSEVVNEKAFLELRKIIIKHTANPNFILQFIDPAKQ
jgi:hypothetical protein